MTILPSNDDATCRVNLPLVSGSQRTFAIKALRAVAPDYFALVKIYTER